MMENWNVVLKIMRFIYFILCQDELTMIHVSIFPKNIIPAFHCSIIPSDPQILRVGDKFNQTW